MKWYRRVISSYFAFSGRSQRAEFWWFTLYDGALLFVLLYLDAMRIMDALGATGWPYGLFGIYYLATFSPRAAVKVRRLHDADLSGSWIWLLWAPPLLVMTLFTLPLQAPLDTGGEPWRGVGMVIAGLGVALIPLSMLCALAFAMMMCMRGTRGANRFGHDPFLADHDPESVWSDIE